MNAYRDDGHDDDDDGDNDDHDDEEEWSLNAYQGSDDD